MLIVSLTIGLFFAVFGLLRHQLGRPAEWIDIEIDHAAYFSIGGEELQVTTELLRVAGGLAAFSGFYFAVAMLTDSTYREEFLEELTDEMRTSFKARTEYLTLRRAEPPAKMPG